MAAPRTRLAQAQLILGELGLPDRQQNELAGYTLLALAQIGPRDKWSSATKPLLRTHDILAFLRTVHSKEYAPNTRETFRRQALHQFEQARVVDRNPDDPTRPTNSGLTCYALTDLALAVVQVYGEPLFSELVTQFLAGRPTLAAQYRRERDSHRIEVTLPDGVKLFLSAGQHNALQAAVVSQFMPRFIPTAKVLYLGDTAKKNAFVDEPGLSTIRVPYSTHDKLPDVLFHLEDRNWLILVEAVTSHGPVSAKRREELEAVLKDCPLQRVYMSAFPSFTVFKKHITEIDWDTEVWVAETPDHMIHFNGPKFLGPAT